MGFFQSNPRGSNSKIQFSDQNCYAYLLEITISVKSIVTQGFPNAKSTV